MNEGQVASGGTDRPMRIGMVGLGRMGSNLVRRLMRSGHSCVAYDADQAAVRALEAEGADGAQSLNELAAALPSPRIVWIMVPAAATQSVIDGLLEFLDEGDVIVDGGNSYYRDDITRSRQLSNRGIELVDCGTSGGVWGLERGYCLMVGGERRTVELLEPIFASIAPGRDAADPTPGRNREGTALDGWLHCGPSGAGHFVKMVHNGIEYGMMAAIAEGLGILHAADRGVEEEAADAETAPLRDPTAYQYRLDVAEIVEVWRRGSVIGSWLVDLTADALARDPQLSSYQGRVADSGEGRWTVIAAVEEGVPAPVISAALQERLASRGLGSFVDRALSAMRREFGGHIEQT